MSDTNDAARLTEPTKWKLRIWAILWFLLIAGCIAALPILLDATFLIVVALLLVAAVLAVVLVWLYRRFAKGGTGSFMHDWLKTSLATFCVLCILVASPIYYFAIRTATDPALLPRAVLTNGEKTVVYQGMMHVGSERFYKQVVYDLEQALADGYVLYYEGVQPDPRGDAWFSKTMAQGGDLSSNYKALGKMCGMQFQSDYFGLLEADKKVNPDRHVIADVNSYQMFQEFERLKREDPVFASRIDAELAERNKPTAGPLGNPVKAVDTLTDGQLKLVGYFCRDAMSDVAREEDTPTQMDKIVVDMRNRHLVDTILKDPHDKIYVTYGAHHLEGILPMLQAADPRWQVESVSWIDPVEAPRKLEGRLKV